MRQFKKRPIKDFMAVDIKEDIASSATVPGFTIEGEWNGINNFMSDLKYHLTILSQKHGVKVVSSGEPEDG